MNKRLKAKWVKLLRSGEYKQARSRLKDPETGGLCCIGVGYVACKGKRPSFSATATASAAIGLTANDADRLVDMNDAFCKSFSQIADYIEKNL